MGILDLCILKIFHYMFYLKNLPKNGYNYNISNGDNMMFNYRHFKNRKVSDTMKSYIVWCRIAKTGTRWEFKFFIKAFQGIQCITTTVIKYKYSTRGTYKLRVNYCPINCTLDITLRSMDSACLIKILWKLTWISYKYMGEYVHKLSFFLKYDIK